MGMEPSFLDYGKAKKENALQPSSAKPLLRGYRNGEDRRKGREWESKKD